MGTLEIKSCIQDKKMEKYFSFNEQNLEKEMIFGAKRMEKHLSFCENKGPIDPGFDNGKWKKHLSFSDKHTEIPFKYPEKKTEKQHSFLKRAFERQQTFREKKKIKEMLGKRGDTTLHIAAREGNLAKIREFLGSCNGDTQKEFLQMQNLDGETALYVASEMGHTSVVSELLNYSDAQTVIIKANNSYDPFHIAVKQGHLDVVRELLRLFPDLAITTDSKNFTALHTAACKGYVPIVNFLLERDTNLAKIAQSNGKTALHSAARYGHIEVVKSLLNKEPGLNFRTDKKGQTALHMAVKGPNTEVVLELIKPDLTVVGLEDNKGNTALHIAANKGRIKIVRILISIEGININSVNHFGETPFDMAEKIAHAEIIQTLKDAGATSGKDQKNPPNAARQLKQTVSDIKHEVQSQLKQTRRTGVRVHKIAKRLKKLHISGLNNAINSATVVAVLIATVTFAAIFTVPGQFVEVEEKGYTLGEARIARYPAFIVFFVCDSLALFISLAVVVVQTSIVVIEQKAKRQLVFVINKLMWLACLFISIAFISLAFVVVGRHSIWLAILATTIGGSIMLTTIGSMCYCVIMHRIEEAKRRSLRKSSGSRSQSWSVSVPSDSDINEYKRIFAL